MRICGKPTIIVYLKNGKPYCLTCIHIAPTPEEVERAHGLGVKLEEESSVEKPRRSTPQSDLLSPDDRAFLKELHIEVADDAASVEKLSSLDGQFCEAHGQIFGPQHRCAVILFELGTYRAIIDFHRKNPLEGYRRLTFMMLDGDVMAVSPASGWRVLKRAGLLSRWKAKPSRKGTGFEQPLQPHQHWHIDVSYINICGTFYYLCSILDGFSRFIVHWDLRESMREADIEVILERAKEKYPEARPRIISDNGPQFIARDFKEFIRISGMTHVRTSPYYPQSNGKLERWHKSLKRECIRERTPLSLEDAKRLIQQYVDHYNQVRLHSAIGYVTPNDMLRGRQATIHAERDRKLEAARQQRSSRRQQAA